MGKEGRVLSCVGGLYTVDTPEGRHLCYAKGNFRVEHESPVAGDRVVFEEADGSRMEDRRGTHGREEYGRILSILARKNLLIRPPLANLDTLFLVLAARDPEPNLYTVDQLSAIACHKGIRVVVICNKSDLEPAAAESFAAVYEKAGFPVLISHRGEEDRTREALLPYLAPDSVSAFAGASGVGKSTLVNTLFPGLGAETGAISQKTLRGKHTTRLSLLFDVSPFIGQKKAVYLADTPGFSLLDFQRFFFMEKEDLPFAFPEFEPYLGTCRYTKCTHTSEEGCQILEAVREGIIAPSRHESYRTLFEELKQKKPWEKKR